MRSFLTKFFIFLLPLLLLFIGVEYYLRNLESSFQRKAVHFQKSKDSLEVLILGASHLQMAINPKYMSRPTANIAFGAQDVFINHALFFRYAEELPRLKWIILEADYDTFEYHTEPDYFRYSWYSIFYDTEVKSIPLFQKASLYASSPEFFNAVLRKPKKQQKINAYGFVEDAFSGVFESFNYNESEIAKDARSRIHEVYIYDQTSLPNFAINTKRYREIITYCQNNKINVLLIKSPVHSTYPKYYVPEKDKRRNKFIDDIRQQKNVYILDLEHISEFGVRDFRDDDHLNPRGAEKLTQVVDSLLHFPR